ncbi:MAG: hypothetical protein K8R48_01170, partial [Alphaproteobacteria bacterium]|nr:hypothetical protein [Alphaproteobacteria bacterium]
DQGMLMHEYADDDLSTPESLLKETVSYARTILNDLQNANIIVGDKWNPNISIVAVACVPDPEDDAFHKKYNPDETIVRREAYEASHPAIVDSIFQIVIRNLMKKAGFRDRKNLKGGHADFREDEFNMGGTRGMLSISDISIACVTLPQNLRRALTVSDEDLEKLCLRSLQQSFAHMGRVRNQADVERVAKIAKKNIKPGFDPKLN